MIDLEFVTFMNNDKCFPTYKDAYFNGQFCGSKKVFYIFTPTWTKCANVGELEHCFRQYFKKRTGFDHFDIRNKSYSTQLNLLEI